MLGLGACDCLVHAIFGGSLRSDVHCASCQSCSTTFDPYVSVSLDIASSDGGDGSGSFSTLAGCLSQFTRREALASSERFYCSRCACLCESTKQLSFQTLGNVICFHLKRFGQHSRGHSFGKVDQRVDFPVTIDMRPYTHAFIEHARQRAERARECGSDDDSSDSDDDALCGSASSECEEEEGLYELFGVVIHSGRADGGHNTASVRVGRACVLGNADQTTLVPIATVLMSQAYVLFYEKKRLCYKDEEPLFLPRTPGLAPSLSFSSWASPPAAATSTAATTTASAPSATTAASGGSSSSFGRLAAAALIIPPRSPRQ